MKSLSLNLAEAILAETDAIVKQESISRNKYISDAITYYNKLKNRKKLSEKMKKATTIIGSSSLDVLQEFEDIDIDYEY